MMVSSRVGPAVLVMAWITASAGGVAGQRAGDVVDLTGPDRSLEGGVTPLYTVGRAEGEEWETFGDIRGVGFDDAGRLHVFDALRAAVITFGPDGRHLRAIGRRGDGPGEFRAPVSFAVLPDGSVVVQDVGHSAYLVFGPDGGHRRQVPLASGRAVRALTVSAGALVPDRRGDAVFDGGTVITGLAPGPEPGGRDIHHVSLAGSHHPRVVHRAWRPAQVGGPGVEARSDGTTAFRLGAPRLLEPRVLLAPLPDGGLAVVDSTTWAVRLIAPSGGVRVTLRRPDLAPEPVTPAVERRERERRLREIDEDGGGPRITLGDGASLSAAQQRAVARSRIESATFYPEIPVIRGLRASPEGTLWLERSPLGDRDRGPVDLVRWDGRYLGTLTGGTGLPDALGPDGLVAWVERDDFDVPRVRVGRLPERLRG